MQQLARYHPHIDILSLCSYRPLLSRSETHLAQLFEAFIKYNLNHLLPYDTCILSESEDHLRSSATYFVFN